MPCFHQFYIKPLIINTNHTFLLTPFDGKMPNSDDEGYNEDYNEPKAKGLQILKKVSPELQAIIGLKEATMYEAHKLTWDYICKNNLQDPENKQFFIPDEKLAKILGTDRCRAMGLSKFINVNLYK